MVLQYVRAELLIEEIIFRYETGFLGARDEWQGDDQSALLYSHPPFSLPRVPSPLVYFPFIKHLLSEVTDSEVQ